jgi:hypothetical protein
MLVKRHLVVWAFAGGCLSGAALIGVFVSGAGAEKASPARTVKQPHVSPPAYLVTDDDDTDDANVADDDHDTANDDPAVAKKTATIDVAVQTETGSSVADVLVRLEVAYRQGLAAAAAPLPAALPAPAPEPAVPEETRITVAVATLAAAPPVAAPPVAAPAVVAPATPAAEPESRLASRDEARPRDIHIGDVHQNTHIGNVHEGDVYVFQQVTPAYVPYYAVPPSGAYAPPAQRRSGSVRHTAAIAPNQSSFSYPPTGVFKYPVDLVH